jgi:hypothetical protein
MDEQEALWRSLCEQAWREQDPVKLLEITMRITRFLTRKQERLETELDERERRIGIN